MWSFVFVALIVSLAMTKKSLRPDFQGATMTVLRIALSFLMMTGFLATLQLDWGSLSRQLFNIAKASSGGMPPFTDCAGISFETEIVVSLLLPLVGPAVAAAQLAAWFLYQRARQRQTALIMGESKKHFFINACVAMSYLLWPLVVMQCLRVLNCSVAVGDRRYVASSLGTQCGVGAHAQLRVAAVAELVTVLPALPAFLLYRLRKFDVSEGSWNGKHLFFLYGGFRAGYEYWEAVVLARKFAVLAIGVFLADNAFGLQVTAVMWVMAASTTVHLLCQPYQHATEQWLETLSLGGMTAALMIGQLILQAESERGLGETGLAVCQGCVATILLSTTFCFFAFFVSEIRKGRRAKREAKEAVAEAELQGVAGEIVMKDNPMRHDSNADTPPTSNPLQSMQRVQ